ncbi:hypothetical protein ACHQM5_026502 [Ranunculus cassubicifolius]
MIHRRLLSNLLRNTQTNQFSSSSETVEKTKGKDLGQKLVQTLLISITGGVALSALDDLAIYQGSDKNQAIKDAIGEPLVKGPWYAASLALAHRRNSVSCSFPVSGPKGTGMFKLKAVRNDERWIPYLKPRNWDLLIMDARMHVPGNEEKNQTFRISLMDMTAPSTCTDCVVSNLRNQRNQKRVKHSGCLATPKKVTFLFN